MNPDCYIRSRSLAIRARSALLIAVSLSSLVIMTSYPCSCSLSLNCSDMSRLSSYSASPEYRPDVPPVALSSSHRFREHWAPDHSYLQKDSDVPDQWRSEFPFSPDSESLLLPHPVSFFPLLRRSVHRFFPSLLLWKLNHQIFRLLLLLCGTSRCK